MSTGTKRKIKLTPMERKRLKQSFEPVGYLVREGRPLTGTPFYAFAFENTEADPENPRGECNWFSPVIKVDGIPHSFCETVPLPPVPFEEIDGQIATLLAGKKGKKLTPWADTSVYGQDHVHRIYKILKEGGSCPISSGPYTMYESMDQAEWANPKINWSGITGILHKENLVYPLKEDRHFLTHEQQSRLAYGKLQAPLLPSTLLYPDGTEVDRALIETKIFEWKRRKKLKVNPDEIAFAQQAAEEVKDQHFIMYYGRERSNEGELFYETAVRWLKEEHGRRPKYQRKLPSPPSI